MKRKLVALLVCLMIVMSAIPALSFADAEAKPELNITAVKVATVEDYTTNDFTLWLEEKTGIHVNFNQIPDDSASEKVAMMFAGGELPDAFLGVGLSSDALLQYGSAGALIALEDYFEKTSPNLIAAMNYYEQGMSLIKQADGHIYSLPSINPCYHCTYANKMWINTVWLDNLGLSIPTTIDEYTEVLRAFRDNDANGNGIADDEIPMAGTPEGWYTASYPFLLNSFLYFDYGKYGFQLDDDKNVYNAMYKDEFREALKYLNMLHEEGLMYEGTLTQAQDQLRQMVENPEGNLVGSVSAGYGGQFVSQIGNERYREYFALEPLKGPQGVQYAMSILQLPSVGQFVITNACENPELALEWADYFYTSEVTASMFNGVEGFGWRWAEDGEIGFNGEPAKWAAVNAYSGNTGDTQNNCWTQIGIFNFSADWRGSQAVAADVDLRSNDGMEYMLHKVTLEMYEPYGALQYCLPTLNYNEEQQTRISDLLYEFQNYYNDVIYGFVTGDMDIDSDADWEAHIENMEVYGVPEICEIYQAAYDVMYK